MRGSSIMVVGLCLILLPGCPAPTFPDCPTPPTLEYSASDFSLIGGWHGEASSITNNNDVYVHYSISLALNPDRSFEMIIGNNDGRFSLVGVWAVDALAKPYPRIQFAVACSDSERFPSSTWMRGSYRLQNDEFSDTERLSISVEKYPYAAIDYPDWDSLVWRLERQPVTEH